MTHVEENTESNITKIVEPTYILQPDKDEKFYPTKVKEIADRVILQEVEKAKLNEKWIEDWYEFSDDIEDFSKSLADKIRDECKALNMPRYKLLVQVTVGQRKDQGTSITSRCLWNTSTDRYAAASFENEHFFISTLCFGLYID